MKITDLFRPLRQGGSGPEAGKGARLIQPVQPVGHVGRLTLVPGQLLQGEVVGEDANGLLLLKLAGEIIAARTPVKLAAGQQFWFEVKEAGDSPLLNLASQKGAVQNLLKDIMATRPLLVKGQPLASPPPIASLSTETLPAAAPGPVGAGEAPSPLPPGLAGGPGPVSSAEPFAPVLAPDGSIPPEAARLVKALLVYMNEPAAPLARAVANGSGQPPELIKTMVSLIREGQIPPALQKLPAFQDVVRPGPALAPVLPDDGVLPTGPASVPPSLVGSPAAEGGNSLSGPLPSPAAALTSHPTSLAPQTIKLLYGLVAVAGIQAPVDGESGPLPPALNPEGNLLNILSLIAREDKVPTALLKLSPLQVLLGNTGVAAPLPSGAQEAAGSEKNDGSGQEWSAARALLPLQFAAAQQGAESLPAQLRLLASLMGLGPQKRDVEGWQEIEEIKKIFGRLSEAEMPAAARKLASFFEAHTRVNAETPHGQSDFYIMPSLFSGQAGWGEWLWSRERSGDDNQGPNQESLVFFLEMSHLGALTIQVILKDKRLRGQILMEDKEGSELVAALLPDLRNRLAAFGYDVVDFPCSCQSLNVMQELRESLHRRVGGEPVSLLDVQA